MIDALIAAAGVIFTVSLVPTVVYQWRVKASTVSFGTSLSTSFALALLITAYTSLHLWLSVATITGNLLFWLVIATQRAIYGERRQFYP